MDYGLIGKIEKAKRYAEERNRIGFESFRAGRWTCDCDFFLSRGVCSHTMALERILEGMLPAGIEAA